MTASWRIPTSGIPCRWSTTQPNRHHPGGLPPIQNIDHDWKPITLPQIAALSADNADTTFYLPDGCGGTVKFNGGVSVNPANPIPIMTRPR
ncbi:MAG: hypothetical protein NVS4B6_21090 [Mycobacterium sp.]